MPSFNGINIFGYGVKIRTIIGKVRRQENEAPGINGMESLTLGTSGCTTMVEGFHAGNGAVGLQAAQDLFESYYDGNTYILLDTKGKTWNNVILDLFEPQGRIKQDRWGFYYQDYTATFVHLTTS